MKSVLHVITGLENGGAEAVLFRLVTNDTQVKHSIISLMGMGKYGSLLHARGIPVYCLDMPKGGITFQGLRKLWKIIRNEKSAILQTWMYHADLLGGVIGKLAGIKNVYWCIHNSTLLPKATPWKTIMVTKICAVLSYVLPSKIISCAQNAIDVNAAAGYSAARFVLVPNGYNLTDFKPDQLSGRQLRTNWGFSENLFLLGAIARFDPQKDLQNLIAACGILVKKEIDFHLILVGPKLDLNNIELNNWIKEENIEHKVTLLGARDDIPQVMNALDILVLSSRGEAFPNVLCEAMACGTPCVSTTVGDAALIVDKTGWLVPPSNSTQLAEGMMAAKEAWQNKIGWQTMKETARNRIESNFGIDKMVQGYHRVWAI